ncbi:MAG: hypothetical protein ACQERD_04410 [Campylobacterota bacterium]
MELIQESLFDVTPEDKVIFKKFTVKDVFFNNGIVNLYRFLKENNFDIELEFQSDYLKLKYKNEKIYFEVLNKFLKDKKIVSFNEKNKRIFFDMKQKQFTQTNKINIKNGGSNDSKNSLIKVHINDLGISQKELFKKEELYKSKYDNHDKDDFKIEKCYYDKSKKEVYVLSTLDKHIERFSSYLVKGDFLVLNSSIHNFEDGQKSFHDMVKISKKYNIDKWEALIYWFGTKVQHYFNYSFFIYPNSSNFEALDIFKYDLQISDEKISFRDKNEKLITTTSNINFKDQLVKDDIFNPYFYISKSDVEFELKFFMYLFSKISHIEEEYEKANKKRKKLKERIYNALQEITFVTYVEDGTFKKSLNEYTKAYQLIRFFEKIKEAELFTYFADIFVTLSMSQGPKEVNVNYQKWCKGLLEFKELRKYYYLISFNILKNQQAKSFGKGLYEFEKLYLKNIMGEKNMNIHEKSKILGDSIGYFCAQLGDKDLLFKLRNVKNYKQLLSYFKDLKFASLKNEEKARFSKEFNESLEEVLNVLENEWEIVRDYIAIYAIDKYKATNYRNKMKKEGK